MKTFFAAFAGFTATAFDVHLNIGSRRTLQRSNVRCNEKDDATNDITYRDRDTYHDDGNMSRRSLLLSFAGTLSSGPASALLRSLSCTDSQTTANAMGLVHFPCHEGDLMNTYHMMRAGESGLEAEGILSTNPLFMTNTEDGLTDVGRMQVQDSCAQMMDKGINPSVVKYSLASKCIDTANIVATTMMIGRNRIIPEFTFMDGRGAGFFDGHPLESATAALWALDYAEAGVEGRGGSPPPTDDGTANESLSEQFTRLRQLLSVLETQFSGDEILLIFPDGTSPALLSCLIAGIPLNEVHALNYEPGELREGVNMKNTLELYKQKKSASEYTSMLAKGQNELELLRKEYEEHLVEKKGTGDLLIPNNEKVSVTAKKPIPIGNSQRSFRKAFGEVEFGSNVFSGGAFGVAAGLAMLKGNNDEDSGESEAVPEVKAVPLAYANSTGASLPFEQRHLEMPATLPALMPAVLPAPSVQMTASNNFADAASPSVYEDNVPELSKEERLKIAADAMDEYLSQDDGGDDWLNSMKEMIDE